MSKEYIAAAAIQVEGVTISLPKPARHGTIMAAFSIYVDRTDEAVICLQGFITNEARFVNRVEARHIAYNAGQNPIYSGAQGSPELFSEDLW